MNRRHFLTSLSAAALAACTLGVRALKGSPVEGGPALPANPDNLLIVEHRRLKALAARCGIDSLELITMLRVGTEASMSGKARAAGNVLHGIFTHVSRPFPISPRMQLYDYGFHYQRADLAGVRNHIVAELRGTQWLCPITHALMPIFATLS